MMGLQATATKRKYELSACGNSGDIQANCTPAKASRWSTTVADITTQTISTRKPATTVTKNKTQLILSSENSIVKLEAVATAKGESWSAEPILDSISRLQAVAVPDTWGIDSSRSSLATTILNADELDEEDEDFEDDFDEEESIIPRYSPMRFSFAPPKGYMPPGYPKLNYYSEPYPQQNCSRIPSQYTKPVSHYGWNQLGYYIPPEAASSQQTIRCAENGKSYLELGSGNYGSIDPRHLKQCCDGQGSWCNNKLCYRDRRLKMRNLSMFKLSRFRQVSEQSLHRSVLICNTLKFIDREMEQESQQSSNPAEFHSPHYSNSKIISSGKIAQKELLQSQPNQYSASDNSISIFSQQQCNNVNKIHTTSMKSLNEYFSPYEHHPLRDSQSGRFTPFPPTNLTDTDSGYGDEDSTRPINWSSVLSLTSQSALDPLNNNDLFTPSTSSVSSVSPLATASSLPITTNCTTSLPLEYNLLDMDLGLGPELTELLPSWKLTPLSADDIMKSMPPPMEPSKILVDNEIDTFTHIMVGS